MNQMDPNNRLAYYGTVMVQADNLAQQRGSGLFNILPYKDQTTDRGTAYKNTLKMYAKSTAYTGDNELKQKLYDKYEVPWGTVEAQLDTERLYPQIVGDSMHPQPKDSWESPDFGNSRGNNQYQIWATNSMNMQPSPLLNFLFSTENVDYLQNKIVEEVFRIRGVRISKQSVDELLIIMRNKYTYALSGWLPRESVGDTNKVYARGTVTGPNGLAYDSGSTGCSNLEYQLKMINKSVLQECVKQVLSGIDAYKKYYEDASSLPMPLSRSVYVSMKGDNVLQPNIGFQSGHEASREIASYNQRFNII